jgi:hypothetical protein
VASVGSQNKIPDVNCHVSSTVTPDVNRHLHQTVSTSGMSDISSLNHRIIQSEHTTSSLNVLTGLKRATFDAVEDNGLLEYFLALQFLLSLIQLRIKIKR